MSLFLRAPAKARYCELIRSTDGLGNTTHYGMDVCSGLTCGNTGNLKSLTDANGNIRRFDYDRHGNLIQETDTQGNATRRQYDAMGRVLGPYPSSDSIRK